MDIETKTVYGDVGDYLKFGWKHTEDVKKYISRSIRTEHVLARDKEMPNYRLIAALEARYFALKSQMLPYEPMDPGWAVALFLLFVIPFIIYFAAKKAEEKRVLEHNGIILGLMDDVLKEVKPLL